MTDPSSNDANLLDRIRAFLDALDPPLPCRHTARVCPLCRRDLDFKLAAIARFAFDHPQPIRPNRLASRLDKLALQVAALARELDDPAISDALVTIEPHRLEDGRRFLRELAESAKDNAQHAAEMADAYGTSKGGRTVDERVGRAARALVATYRHVTGMHATVTQDPETGNLTGPFGTFAFEFFRAFYPGTPQWTAIREALRQATADVREDDAVLDSDRETDAPPPSLGPSRKRGKTSTNRRFRTR